MADDMQNFAFIDPATLQVVGTCQSTGLPNGGPNWVVEAPEGVLADYWLDLAKGLYVPGPSHYDSEADAIPIGEFAVLSGPPGPAELVGPETVLQAAADDVAKADAPAETAIARAKRRA